DIASLMQAVCPLANILRYGTARKLPEAALKHLVTSMAAEIYAGLGPACRGLDDEATRTMFTAVQSFDRAVHLLNEQHHNDSWLETLGRLELDDRCAAFLRGFALRRLYDQRRFDEGRTAQRLDRALSPAIPVLEAGQ